MTSRFFRFLSKRGNKSSTSNSNKIITNQINQNNQNEANTSTTKHVKLNVCEDLKESIEHYNQRCLEIKKLKEKQEIEQKINNLQQPAPQQQQQHNSFFNFKSFKNKNKSSSTINNQLQNLNQTQQPSKDTIECAIVFLDDTQESFYLPKKSLASKLYEQVFYHLDLIETDYFGLQFSDTHNVKHWLDPTKPIKKQCKIGPPYQFFFKVKFYTAEPNNLKEELTRYFYFLQLKQDLKLGQLTCTFQEQICVELCALILQEELGDYDPSNHFIETISEFRFLPDYQQTEDFEEKIFEKYSTSSSYKGMTPAEAELTFLNKAKWLEMYGVDMHSVYGRDQNEYKLGLTPSGILVFEETIQNHQNSPNQPPIIYNKIGLFYWPKIEKVTFSKKKFTILVAEDDNNGFKQEHTFIFNLIDEKACKHLWKCAVEYHAFFRLRTSPRQLMLLNSSSTNGLFNGFIRRGSRFRGPERTEFQTHNLSRLTTPRRSVQFERRPSQRFSRRASYAMKRKLHEQQKNTQVQIPEPKPRNSGQNALVPSLSDTKLNNDTVSNPTTASTSQVNVNNCCKLQQTSNGIEHDQKCDLYKAQLLRQQNENIVCKSGSSSSKCSSAESTCSESSSSAVISSSSNEKIVDDEDSVVISPKSVKNKKLVDESVLSNETNKIGNKELLLSKSKDASVISNMSNIATVPGNDIRSRPRSNNVKISHINALNNINATAFTINNVNRLTTNQKANERPPLVINNLNNNINANKQPIMTEL